ncbi:MAG: hypothetical protein HYU66_27005 [Armatimonadetes bacterium]|nr:hypothetical protein [Armatimonadota bacterium]
MAQSLPVLPEIQATRAQTPARPEPERPSGPGAALDRPALPFNKNELYAIAGVLLLASLATAITLFYLTAFAKVGAKGALQQKLQSRLGELRQDNGVLEGVSIKDGRGERLDEEAQRLGLVVFSPERTDHLTVPASLVQSGPPVAVPAGGGLAATPAAWPVRAGL